mmetsp:Transcript_2525/g.3722  ORF Transcript_2525/g.3722 Transcript_2525/m.3722 type:complete len:1222 (+) Transcript_2525:77-3742(+)
MLTPCRTKHNNKSLVGTSGFYRDSSSKKTNKKEMNIITPRRCGLSFRPPRTITTDDHFSWEQDQQDNVLQYDNNQSLQQSGPSAMQFQQGPFTKWDGDDPFIEFKSEELENKNLSQNHRDVFNTGTEHQIMVQNRMLDDSFDDQAAGSCTTSPEDADKQKNQNDLLMMPTPKDRSHRRRLKKEREQGMIHTYGGEQEPPGFRGQEARIGKKNVKSPYLQLNKEGLALRLFESSLSIPIQKKMQTGMSVSSSSTDECIRRLVSDLPSPNRSEVLSLEAKEVRPSDDSNERSVSTSSTNSSQTLENMMTDLLQDGQMPNDDNLSVCSLRDMSNTAQKHVDLGEFDSALNLFKRILIRYHSKYGEYHPLVAATYHNLGIVHSKRADLIAEDKKFQQLRVRQKALLCFQAAARAARDSLGREHPNVAISLVKIGFLHLSSQQYHTALLTFREALRIRKINFAGKPHLLIANLHNNLGICHLHLKQFKDSNKHFCKALQIQRQILEAGKIEYTRDELRVRLLELADALENLGGLSLEWLQQASPPTDIKLAADSQLAESIAIRSSILGPDHQLSTQVIGLREMLHAVQSKYPEERIPVILPATKQDAPYGAQKSSIANIVTPENSSNRPPMDAPPDIECLDSLVHDSMVNSGGSENKISHKDDPPSQDIIIDSVRAINDTPVRDTDFKEELVSVKVLPIRDSDSACSEFLDQVFDSLQETLSTEEEMSSLSSLPNQRNVPRENKIFMSQHCIPRHSPVRIKKSRRRGSSSEVADHRCSDSMRDDDMKTRDYDTEEYCVISSRGEWEEFMTPSPIYCDQNGNDEEVNLMPHDIMIICPSTDTSRCIGEPRLQASLSFKDHRKNSEYDQDESCIDPFGDFVGGTNSQSIRLTQSMLDHPELHLPEIHAFAAMCLKSNRLSEAQQLFTTIFHCQRKILGEVHEDIGSALHNIGLTYLRSNDHIQALGYFERAVRMREGALGKEHPDVAISKVKVGISLLLMRNFDLALQSFLDALNLRKQSLSVLHPSNACIYNNIGCIHIEFKELRNAKIAFEAALNIQRNALSLNPASGHLLLGAATTLCNLGYLYQCRKKHQKVAVFFKEALDLQMCVLGETHPTVLTTMESLADALSFSEVFSQGLWNYSYIISKLNEGQAIENKFETEAIVFYKMAKVHRKEHDFEAELEKLQLAQESAQKICVRSEKEKNTKTKLEHLIQVGIRYCRGGLMRA